MNSSVEDGLFNTDDGLSLHYRQYMPSPKNIAKRTPIICLPGLTRNVRDFDKLARYLSTHSPTCFRVITLDYRGRGQSDWDENKKNYNIIREADDVLQLMDHLKLDRASFIGTSRGGLILHIMATIKPEALSAIIFNDIGPEIELAGLLDIQQYLEKPKLPQSWQEAAAIQKEIHEKEFPLLDDEEWLEMAYEIYSEKDGKILPECDPAVVNSIKILDTQTELPTLWEQFKLLHQVPVFTIRGANSRLFSQKTLDDMNHSHPNHQALVVDDQGHPPILHSDGIKTQISDFLAKHTV